MKPERIQLALKLISSHLLLIPLIIIFSLFIANGAFLCISIAQTILVIIFLTGYWEFFGLRFRLIYFGFIEVLIIGELWLRLANNASSETNWNVIVPFLLIQIFLIYVLVKIIVVIFREERNKLEIIFPFSTGRYLITDGGNSRISRMMNYHFHSAIHKKNRTNYSMLFATDIIRLDGKNKGFMPMINESYPIFENTVVWPIQGRIIKIVNDIEDNIPFPTRASIIPTEDPESLSSSILLTGFISDPEVYPVNLI